MPKVSIIVPVYNTEKYLRTCLDSIVAQTFTDFEAVLVDDGSTDQSGTLCDEYAAKDSRFIVVHKQNEGVAKARISAFEHCKGEYVTFIDSDDFVNPHYLDRMMNVLREYHVDMVSCQYCTYHEGISQPTKRSVSGYLDSDKIRIMLHSNFLYDKATNSSGIPIVLWTKLIHKKYVLDALQVGVGLKWSEDQVALFHILLHINSLYVLDDCLYYYVMRPGQATNKYCTEMLRNQLEAYRKYQQIDVNGLYRRQYHIRTWLFGIKKTIFHKMPLVIHDHTSFVNELRKLDMHPSWKDFFCNKSTYLGWKNNLQFWILKLRMYNLFYFIYYCRMLNKFTHE